MKITISKSGVIKMTATSKKDSLNLLKFLSNAAGNNDPERKKLIAEKEKELSSNNNR